MRTGTRVVRGGASGVAVRYGRASNLGLAMPHGAEGASRAGDLLLFGLWLR